MSKHFLGASMRLYEIGNRLFHEGKEKEAKDIYNDAAELYRLFFELNFGLGNIKIKNNEKKGIFSSMKKLLECCNE